MNKLNLLLVLLIVSCSSVDYSYQERHIVPDSLKDDLRKDFISVIDYDNLNLAGDPDHDDDISMIFSRLKATYQVKVGHLKIIDSNIRYIPEPEIGKRYKVIYDSLKSEYYGN